MKSSIKREPSRMADKGYSQNETSASEPEYCNIQIWRGPGHLSNLVTWLGKSSRVGHKHKPSIERILPVERIVGLFYRRFDQPYVNPLAELSFEELTAAFPDVPESVVMEALEHWTNHSGRKVLQTKVARVNAEDKTVWFVHGLEESPSLGPETPML